MMTHEQWMKDTAIFARVRSRELVAVDLALLAFHAPGGDAAAKKPEITRGRTGRHDSRFRNSAGTRARSRTRPPTTLRIPTGKLDALKQKVTKAIDG
jgi:hypothetical protein